VGLLIGVKLPVQRRMEPIRPVQWIPAALPAVKKVRWAKLITYLNNTEVSVLFGDKYGAK